MHTQARTRPRFRLLAAALLCLTAACSDSGNHRTVLRFWAMGREAEAMQKLAPEFERLHPDIELQIQMLPWSAAHEKLLTAFAGDATPDIAQIGNTWLPELVALGALAPLEEPLRASSVLRQENYFPGVWETNRVEGRLYGLPWYVDTRLLFYRRDLLKQAGFDAPARSWPEWLEQMRAIKRLVGKDRFAILLPLNEFEPLQVMALNQPDGMLRDGNRYGNFSSPSFRKALDFYGDLFREKLAPPESETQISNVWQELGRGYFSFYISGPWNIAEFEKRLPPEQQSSWGTAPMPGPQGPGVSSPGGSSFAIFARSRHREAAWKLVEFLSSVGMQQRFFALTGDLPARRDAWHSPALEGDPYLRAFGEQLTRVRPLPQVPEFERIMEEMRLMSERVVREGQDPAAATAALDARVDGILTKRRWMLARRSGR